MSALAKYLRPVHFVRNVSYLLEFVFLFKIFMGELLPGIYRCSRANDGISTSWNIRAKRCFRRAEWQYKNSPFWMERKGTTQKILTASVCYCCSSVRKTYDHKSLIRLVIDLQRCPSMLWKRKFWLADAVKDTLILDSRVAFISQQSSFNYWLQETIISIISSFSEELSSLLCLFLSQIRWSDGFSR